MQPFLFLHTQGRGTPVLSCSFIMSPLNSKISNFFNRMYFCIPVCRDPRTTWIKSLLDCLGPGIELRLSGLGVSIPTELSCLYPVPLLKCNFYFRCPPTPTPAPAIKIFSFRFIFILCAFLCFHNSGISSICHHIQLFKKLIFFFLMCFCVLPACLGEDVKSWSFRQVWAARG